MAKKKAKSDKKAKEKKGKKKESKQKPKKNAKEAKKAAAEADDEDDKKAPDCYGRYYEKGNKMCDVKCGAKDECIEEMNEASESEDDDKEEAKAKKKGKGKKGKGKKAKDDEDDDRTDDLQAIGRGKGDQLVEDLVRFHFHGIPLLFLNVVVVGQAEDKGRICLVLAW